MRDIKFIVVHCTASRGKTTVQDLQKHWKSQGWTKPGYHKVVEKDGCVVHLQIDDLTTNGVAGHNSNALHISYIGGVDDNLKAKDTRTKEQKESLIKEITEWKKKYPKAKILGHRDLSPDKDKDGIVEANEWIKMCPSFNAIEEYKSIK